MNIKIFTNKVLIYRSLLIVSFHMCDIIHKWADSMFSNHLGKGKLVLKAADLSLKYFN